jgi:hypothetical protein
MEKEQKKLEECVRCVCNIDLAMMRDPFCYNNKVKKIFEEYGSNLSHYEYKIYDSNLKINRDGEELIVSAVQYYPNHKEWMFVVEHIDGTGEQICIDKDYSDIGDIIRIILLLKNELFNY